MCNANELRQFGTTFTTKTHPEHFISLLVTGDCPDGHNEGMSRVVHSSLNDVVEGVAGRRHPVAQGSVNGGGQAFRHPVVVLKVEQWIRNASDKLRGEGRISG